ncbi:MAG: ribbon-helix-helix protein, CopG family [Dehalococcoidia bacterium]|nr:ribbon-helix-helix protein, CopG family [Dehalococcoidia bacterium]
MPGLKPPPFKTLEEEAKFWDTHDTTPYVADKPETELKFKHPLAHIFSLRLESDDVRAIAALARERHVGTTTMMRELIREALRARAEGAGSQMNETLEEVRDMLGQLMAQGQQRRVGERPAKYTSSPRRK